MKSSCTLGCAGASRRNSARAIQNTRDAAPPIREEPAYDGTSALEGARRPLEIPIELFGYSNLTIPPQPPVLTQVGPRGGLAIDAAVHSESRLNTSHRVVNLARIIRFAGCVNT